MLKYRRDEIMNSLVWRGKSKPRKTEMNLSSCSSEYQKGKRFPEKSNADRSNHEQISRLRLSNRRKTQPKKEKASRSTLEMQV